VIGTASAGNEDFLRDLGVDTFIEYRTTRFEDVVADLDVVFDTLAGEVRDRSWSVLKEDGMLVSIRSGVDHEVAAHHRVRSRHVLVRPEQSHLVAIDRLARAGELRPAVAACFPLREAAKAHTLSEGGHVRGKLVLDIVTSRSN
jgi:NADPH:quinone reductase-like Zn-dependent oxidoreductase